MANSGPNNINNVSVVKTAGGRGAQHVQIASVAQKKADRFAKHLAREINKTTKMCSGGGYHMNRTPVKK